MDKKTIIFSIVMVLAFAGSVHAYYDYYPYDYYSSGYYDPYSYYSDYGSGYDYYSYPSDYYSYDYGYYYPAYDYTYSTYPDSYYFYYEHTDYEPYQPAQTYYQPSYCQNPYASDGQKNCVNSAVYTCRDGSWLFDHSVQCCQSGDCQPRQSGDYCYYSKSCSNYQCTTGYQQFCPAPGTTKNGICYYGSNSCTSSGCMTSKCVLQSNQRCDADQGCVSTPCDDSLCDSKDGWYCRGGDVTREFRDYYCSQSSGQTCSYTITQSETKRDGWECDGDYKQYVHYTCANGEISLSVSSRTFCQNGCQNGMCRQETCNSDCGSQSGFFGDRFCKYGDVYRQFRNYYCSGSSCQYTTEDRRVETCNGYCSNGQCDYNHENCDDKDGFYGTEFCKYGNVYQEYRNYYGSGSYCYYNSEDRLKESCSNGCSSGECINDNGERCEVDIDIRNYQFAPQTITVPPGALVVWTNRGDRDQTVTSDDNIFNSGNIEPGEVYRRTFLELGEFDYHSSFSTDMQGTVRVSRYATCNNAGCDNRCVGNVWYYGGQTTDGCQNLRLDCDSQDSNLGAPFCKDSDVYVRYRDSSCSQSYGGCDSKIYDKKVQDCTGGCSNGQCIGQGQPQPGVCENKCDAWSDWYRVDNQMERRQTCYSYIRAGSSCILSKTFTAIQRAPAGQVGVSLEKEKSFQFGFNISQTRQDDQMTRDPTRLYNGLIFGSNEVRFSLAKGTYINKLSFNVDGKNNYGNLLVYLGDKLIYGKNPDTGYAEITVDETLDQDTELIIRASSSEWKIWAPNAFDLGKITLSVRTDVVEKDSFDMEIYQDEYDGFTKGEIQITPTDGFDIFLNGNRLANNQRFDKSDLKVGVNTFEFVPRPGRSYSGTVVVNVFYRSDS